MSLANSPENLFRPEKNALKMLFPSAGDLSLNSFDEFFDREFYNPDYEDNSDNGIGDGFLENLMPSIDDSVPLTRPQKGMSSPQPWRKGLWCLTRKSTPALVVEKTRRPAPVNQTFVSPPHLVNNQNSTAQSPQRPTKISYETMNIPSQPKADTHGRNRYLQPPVTREQTLSPSPTYAQIPAHSNMAHYDDWQRDFQNIQLRNRKETQLTASTIVNHTLPHNDVHVRQVNSKNVARNATVAQSSQSPKRYHYPFQHVTNSGSGYVTTNDSFDPPVSQPRLQMTANPTELRITPYHYVLPDQNETTIWTTESLYSSDSSHNSHGSYYSHDSFQPTYGTAPQQSWMSPRMDNAHLDGSMTSQEYYSSLAAPIPQRAPHNVLHQQQEMDTSGRGIGFPGTEDIGVAVSYEPHQQRLRPTTPQNTQMPEQNALAFYPPLPPPVHPIFDEESPFTTPKRRVKSTSRSPSPPVSPTHGSTIRSLRQRSPSRPEYNHNRRKSISKNGPIKDASQDGRSRARSSSRPPRTPKTPRTPTGGFQIDFVNFTPKDSAKLMADVAPSGSSKTRARREQEAREKKKKLTEAALQAVKRAGGDITALEKAIRV